MTSKPVQTKRDCVRSSTAQSNGCPDSTDNGNDSPLDKSSNSPPLPAEKPYTSPLVANYVSPQVMRLAGSGMELAIYTLLLGAVGYWADSRLGSVRPWLAVLGALLGFTLGMYRLIVLAIRVGNSKNQ